MVHRCVVNTCSTTFGSRGRHCKQGGVKLHRFPRAPARLSAWIDNIRAVNGSTWVPNNTDNVRICSLHFPPDAYELERQDGLVKLRWNALPTIFLYPKSGVSPAKPTVTTDHLYSVARDEATRQEKKNSRRKVLESIMNSRIPDHVYASPYEFPLCKIQSAQTVDCEEFPPEDDDAFPTLIQVETNEDCEVIDLDEESSDSIKEIPVQKEIGKIQEISQTQVKTCLINGLLHIELPDGRLAQLLSGLPPSEKKQAKNTFTDSEVDKFQIKQLSEENRKLQDELTKVRGFAEKLLRQNERLRQQNRVTTRAYRELKNLVERSNQNLSKRLNKDQIRAMSTNSTRGQKWSQETVQEAIALRAKCGTAVYKEISQRLPYPSVRTLQDEVHKQKNVSGNGDSLELLAADVPEESRDDSVSVEPFVMNQIVDT